MTLGLCGAHRVGKSTLAETFCADTGMLFLRTSVSSVFMHLGLDPAQDYPFSMRLSIQKAVLANLVETYRSAGTRAFVTDRTPLDLIAYLLADVQRQNVTDPDLISGLTTYIDQDLFKYDTVWAAAGNPRSVFEITASDLQQTTGGQVIDVT